MPTDPPPAWRFHLLWVSAAAVVLDLGRMHAHHQADSLIPVLSSLYAWTPYYWEQNRFGMPVALLATPFTHPLTNLLVQNGITLWAALACFPLGVAYLFRDRAGPAAGPLTAAAFLLACPADTQFLFGSTVSVISTSLALGLAGLLAARGRRFLLAAGCFAVGSWTNSALGPMLAPLVVAVAAADARERRPGWQAEAAVGLGLCGFGTVLALVLQRLAPYRTTWVRLPPRDRWLDLLFGWWQEFAADPANLVWVGLVVGVWVVAVAARPADRRRLLTVVGLVVLGEAAYTALMLLVFDGRIRYLGPALVLFHLAAVGGAVVATVGRVGRWWAAVAVLAAAVWTGQPAPYRVQSDVRAKWGADADALLAADATHLTGDYWRVWPAVFQANSQAADAGHGPRVWGVTHRSGPTAHRWKAVPVERMRVAVFLDDPKADDYFPLLGRPPQRDRRAGPFLLFVPADPP